MTSKEIKRMITKVLIVIIVIILAERVYNARDEFHVEAEDASYYGFIEANLTTKEKLKDFEYLYSVLEENYPFFEVNKRQHGVDWLGNKKKYKRLIRNTKNDAEFYVAMDRILKDLHNGHVNIFNGRNYRYFYKNYYLGFLEADTLKRLAWYDAFSNPYVKNRYDFDASEESIEEIEIFNENNLKTKILIEDELAYMKIYKMNGLDGARKDYPIIKEFFKEVEDYKKLIIDIRGNGGGNNIYWKNIMELLIDKPLSMTYYSFFKGGHRDLHLDPYKVRYLTTIENLDEKVLEKFPEEVKTDFDYYKISRINVNPWGVSHNPNDYVDFKGKIYLLVDRGVFSSSEIFSAFAKDTGFATLVGEPTGGDSVSEGIPIIHLPVSKFVIRYSRELRINADGTINMETKTTPHIQVDPTPHEDFNKDPCIQAVIEDKGNNK